MEIENVLQNYVAGEKELLNSADSGLFLINREMEIIWVNKLMESWFGKDFELVGKKCYISLARRDTVCENCPAQKALQDKKPHINDLRARFTINGKKKYYKLTATPILNKQGSVEKILQSLIDITEKRKKDIKNKRLSIETRRLTKEIIKLSGSYKKLTCRRYAKLRLANEELRTIYKLENRLISSFDVKEVLSSIVNLVPKLLRVSGCIVRIVDETTAKLKLEAAYGVSSAFEEEAQLVPIGEGISGTVVKSREPLAISDILKGEGVRYYKEYSREGMRSLLAAPIIFKNNVLGVIIAFSKKVKRFTASEINLISTFAAHAAIALNNAIQYNKVHFNYYNTIITLVKTIEARDPYTCGHSERVTNYAIKIAKTLSLSRNDMELLLYAGKLHDIGKIAIPDFILKKTTALTPTEKAEIEAHPVKGIEMLTNLKFLRKSFPLIRHHHERYDGRGYPDKLKNAEIPFLARILSLADAFDAMTSERPYRRGLEIGEAIEEIKDNSAAQFDPQLAKLFVSILHDYPDIKIINGTPNLHISLSS